MSLYTLHPLLEHLRNTLLLASFTPLKNKAYKGLLNIRVKCNILLKDIIRELKYIIYKVKNLYILIINNKIIPFIKLTRIKLEILEGISCNEVFFLIKDILKILLNMLFIVYILV
jgi:hypothetical protein